jgi:hypothetical protein
MGSSLVWHTIPKGKDLPTGLKWIIEKRYQLPWTFDQSDIKYLEGLRDSGIEGADQLIEAIEKYEEIVVKLEY